MNDLLRRQIAEESGRLDSRMPDLPAQNAPVQLYAFHGFSSRKAVLIGLIIEPPEKFFAGPENGLLFTGYFFYGPHNGGCRQATPTVNLQKIDIPLLYRFQKFLDGFFHCKPSDPDCYHKEGFKKVAGLVTRAIFVRVFEEIVLDFMDLSGLLHGQGPSRRSLVQCPVLSLGSASPC
jgi:hypothetical protein